MTVSEPASFLLRQHFKDWITDFTVFWFLLVLSILFSISHAFSSIYMPSLIWRFLYWWSMFAELYVCYGLVGAAIASITGRRFRGNLGLEMIASFIVPVFMAWAGRATLAWFSMTSFTIEGVIDTGFRFILIMPVLVLSANRVRRLVESHREALAALSRNAAGLMQGATGYARTGKGPDQGAPDAITETAPSMVIPLYLEAEDHHVKIVFPDRVVIRRITLASEMNNWLGHGHRVHRSYWVSFNSVSGWVWIERRLLVKLKTGERVPVGRTYEAKVLGLMKKLRDEE